MRETDSFVKYEKQTTAMDVSSTVLAAVFFAVAIIATVLEFVLYKEVFNVFFYIAVACAVGYICIPLPLGIIAHRRKVNIDLYRSYVKVLGRNPHNAALELSEGLGITVDTAVCNFIKLNSLGFFDNIFIDKDNMVVNLGLEECDSREFVCPVCGGKTEINEGDADVCGFCGTLTEKGE